METKKKYHFGLILFFLVLLELLFINCSCSLADSEVFTPITQMTPYIFNQILDKIEDVSTSFSNNSTPISNFETFRNNFNVEQACAQFNNYFADKTLDYFENCSIIITIYNSKFQIILVQNNNTHHSSFPYIKIWRRSSTETDYEYVGDNGTNINGLPYYLIGLGTDGNLVFASSIATYSRITETYGNSPTFDNNGLINCPYYIGFKNIQNCVAYYVPANGTAFWGRVNNFVLLSDPQEEPSGDSSTNSGLGYITNPSGENGGNINLQPIQNSLNNIQNQISGDSQKIIDNQNLNLSNHPKLANQMEMYEVQNVLQLPHILLFVFYLPFYFEYFLLIYHNLFQLQVSEFLDMSIQDNNLHLL